MAQSRTSSVFEACADTGTGFVITMAVSFVYYKAQGVVITGLEITALTGILTVASLARKYVIRRIFERGA